MRIMGKMFILNLRQLSVEDSSKAAALYTLTRDHLEHGQLSKDEIAEMILTGSLKGVGQSKRVSS